MTPGQAPRSQREKCAKRTKGSVLWFLEPVWRVEHVPVVPRDPQKTLVPPALGQVGQVGRAVYRGVKKIGRNRGGGRGRYSVWGVWGRPGPARATRPGKGVIRVLFAFGSRAPCL
jgi:hypothetical protein